MHTNGYQPIATQAEEEDEPNRRGSTASSFGRGSHAAAVRERSVSISLSADEVAEEEAHAGVSTVEATQRVYGRYSRWTLYVSLGLAAYIYSLDGSTTYNYLWLATSSFGQHSLLSAVQVAQGITVAVGKPVVAKIADVSSRGTAYLVVLIFYVLGYLIIASSQGVVSIIFGIIFYAVGYTGLQLLTAIIIADITTLKWRGIVSSLSTTPFIVNAFLGSLLSSWVIENIGWRWGYLMFAILVPIALSPLIVVLLWAEARAKRKGILRPVSALYNHRQSLSFPQAQSPSQTLGHRPSRSYSPVHVRSPTVTSRLLPRVASPRASATHPRPPSLLTLSFPPPPDSKLTRLRRLLTQLDAPGLLLLGLTTTLILVPLTISQSIKNGWDNPLLPTSLLFGVLCIPVFIWWENKGAERPVIPARFWMNGSVMGASVIGAFDFASFYLTYTYLMSFVLVVKPWSLVNATYFNQIQTVAMTVCGIFGGVLMRVFHRYKYILVAGVCIRLVGVTLMLYTRSPTSSSFALVMTQVLQGVGGGFAAVSSQVGAQASVPHADLATFMAGLLLFTEIGGAVGGSLSGAIWSKQMPERLEHYLPFLSAEERKELFGSIKKAAEKPMGDPVREGVIHAYSDVMYNMVLLATVMSIVPVLVALVMPNWYLGDNQNAVENVGVAGERVGSSSSSSSVIDLEEDEDEEGGRGGDGRYSYEDEPRRGDIHGVPTLSTPIPSRRREEEGLNRDCGAVSPETEPEGVRSMLAREWAECSDEDVNQRTTPGNGTSSNGQGVASGGLAGSVLEERAAWSSSSPRH